MNIEGTAKAIAAIVGVVSICFGVYFYIDNTYVAKLDFERVATDFSGNISQVNLRVTLNELKQLLREAESDMYFYRKQLRAHPGDEGIAHRLKGAEEEVRNLKERIKKLKEQADAQ